MKTTNYDLFSFMDNNRNISHGLINRIIESINKIGYIESRPIIVNESFIIIDGQHRFEACKKLGLPIFYAIENLDINEAMILLNKNQLIWRLQDYVKSWSKTGIECYIQLVKFEEEFHFGISNNLIIFNGNGSNTAEKIRSGKQINVNPKRYEIANYILKCKEFVPFYKTKTFVNAVQILFKKVDADLSNKVLNRIQTVRQQTNVTDYLTAFENILNKGKHGDNKVSLTCII